MDPLVLTEHDVQDKNLLLRFLRKVVDRIVQVSQRLGRVEAVPPPPSSAQIRDDLQATGRAPLNVQSLLGVLAQAQLAGAPRYSTVPTDQVLQGLRDTQLLLVTSTSTASAYDLYTVVQGNPTTLSKLISGLGSTGGGGFVTLDTVQTITTGGQKSITAPWVFTDNVLLSTSTSNTAQRRFHLIGSDGPVAAFPTIAARDFMVLEDNNNAQFAFIKGVAAQTAGIRVFISGSTGVRSYFVETADVWNCNVNGTTVHTISTAAATQLPPFSSYNGDALSTSANGVPSIVGRDTLLNQSDTSATITLFTPVAAGEYRLSYVMMSSATGTKTWQFNAIYTDITGTRTEGSPTTLSCVTLGSHIRDVITLRSCAASAIQYRVNMVTTTTGGQYTAYTLLERLS